MHIWLYGLGSVVITSLISLIGLFSIRLTGRSLEKFLVMGISLAIGALLGDTVLHLLPDSIKSLGYARTSSLIIAGFVIFFIMELFLHWRHHHAPRERHGVMPVGILNLIGDAIHNSIDGMLIAAAYIASIPIGVATSLAVIFHEIPHEVGNYSVLIKAGFSRVNALWFNFLTALTAIAGFIAVGLLGTRVTNISPYIIAFTAGGFIYLIGALLKELKKDWSERNSFLIISSLIAGVLIMWLLVLLD